MYQVNVSCVNCGAEQRIELPTGTKVDDSQCPVCQCKTLCLSWFAMPEVVEGKEEKVNDC